MSAHTDQSSLGALPNGFVLDQLLILHSSIKEDSLQQSSTPVQSRLECPDGSRCTISSHLIQLVKESDFATKFTLKTPNVSGSCGHYATLNQKELCCSYTNDSNIAFSLSLIKNATLSYMTEPL